MPPPRNYYVRNIVAILIVFLVGIALYFESPPRGAEVKAQTGNPGCQTCSPDISRTIYAPTIGLPEADPGDIVLNCRSTHVMEATPTFYTEDGLAIPGDGGNEFVVEFDRSVISVIEPMSLTVGVKKMKMVINRYSRFPVISLTVVLLMFVALFMGLRFFIDNVSSQEIGQTARVLEKPMQKEEKSWVEVLQNKQLQRTSPEKVLEAINELGKIAQLRGISSTHTIEVLANYLDVHEDSLIQKKRDSFKPPGIVFEPHLMMPEERFPAVVAFAYIGKLAIPTLLQVIERNESDSVISINTIFLLKYYFREDFNKAADLLRESADLAKSEEGRQRLLIAADNIARKLR